MFATAESPIRFFHLRLDLRTGSWQQGAGARPAAGRLTITLLTLFLLVACDSAGLPFSPRPGAPAFTISDGANGGTAGFYFLSPLVPDPVIAGAFDPALAPEVRICELGASGCTATVASFSASTSPAVTVDLKEESYSVVWKTKDANLDPARTYRLEVRVGALLLGFADIAVVQKPGALKHVAPGFVGLAAGHPLAIRFRIETGIISQVIVSPGSAMTGVGSYQQFTATFLDLHGQAVAAPHGFLWSSSDHSVADVDSDGVATALAAGEAAISATHGQLGGQASLLVLGEILFASDRTGDSHLYLQSPGGAAALVTAGLDVFAFDGGASWAPNAASIALTLELPTAPPTIHVLPLGGTPVPLAPGGRPRWSPDGQRLAFFENTGGPLSGNEIWVVNADGSGLLELVNTDDNDTDPSWSPDGQWIAFARQRSALPGVYRIRPDGTGLARMSSNLPLVSGPEWSPDGSRLLYTGSPTLTIFSSDIYVVMADGTGEVKLTDTPGVHESHAQWSPDGTRIVFVRRTSEPSTDIWVMNADGTGQMNLTADLAADLFPAWSPDGKAIAFSSDRTGDAEIYITRADGSATLRMTNSPGADTRPRWRPRP